MAAIAKGARCTEVEVIVDEMEATRHALDAGHEGDVVVVCVDYANNVWKELQRRQHGGSGPDAERLPDATADFADPELEELAEAF